MRNRAALLALCGLCLAAAGVSAQFGSAGLSWTTPRFTRSLKQDLGSIATYLYPTEEPAPCSGPNCCQQDSYSSPYGLLYRNRTQNTYGGRTYTTFFYSFHSNNFCHNDLENDPSGCCTASADNIWIDVDPTLKVKAVTYNGKPLASFEQSQYGLKLGSVSTQVRQAAAGIAVTVTVEGAASALCPLPGLAPVPGFCELVIQGPSSTNPLGCCPTTITRNSADTFLPPDDAFQCMSSIGGSPYKMVFDGVAAPELVNGVSYVDYSFRLVRTTTCIDDSIGDCCNAQLSYVTMKVTNLVINKVLVGGQEKKVTVSEWNEPNSKGYYSLLIDELNYVADDLHDEGVPVTVQVKLLSSEPEKDLCDSSPNAEQGSCFYVMGTEDGVCCASDTVLPDDLPPPPEGTCKVNQLVSKDDVSYSLAYYDYQSTNALTTFEFLLANHNSPTCNKRYCGDVCSWTLYIRPEVAGLVTVGHESSENNGLHRIQGGADASVTFTYGPAEASTTTYYINLDGTSRKLSDLCRRNALPGQGTYQCAAMVRSLDTDTFIMVYFNDDCIACGASPPPPTVPQLCPNARPMSEACASVQGGYNTFGSDTVYQFNVSVVPAGTVCTPASSNGNGVVHVVLTPGAVDKIGTNMQVTPSVGFTYDRNTGVRWAVSAPQLPELLKFLLSSSMSVSDVCVQGLAPDQPAGTCVVELSGDQGCFRSFVPMPYSSAITNPWVGAPKDRGVDAAVVVPAVVIPILLLLIALIIIGLIYRRRRQQRYAYAGSNGSDGADLNAPLAGRAGSATGSLRDDLSVPSASPSDVQIRVKGASQGGAGPSGRR